MQNDEHMSKLTRRNTVNIFLIDSTLYATDDYMVESIHINSMPSLLPPRLLAVSRHAVQLQKVVSASDTSRFFLPSSPLGASRQVQKIKKLRAVCSSLVSLRYHRASGDIPITSSE